MKKFLLLGIMLIGLGSIIHAAKENVTFSASFYCNASWNAETSTMSWNGVWDTPSGGWGSFYFIEMPGVKDDMTSFTKFHATLSNFSNNVDHVWLRVKNGDNNYADTKLVAGENDIDLQALATANPGVDFSNVTDVTIWGAREAVAGKEISANSPASVKITDVYFEKEDAGGNHYLRMYTDVAKTDPWQWGIDWVLDAPLEQGVKYVLKMKAKASESFSIWFWPYIPNGATVYTGYNIGTEWNECTCEFTANGALERLAWDFGPIQGYLWFDDITLTEKESGTILMQEDFENGMSANWSLGWNKPTTSKIMTEATDDYVEAVVLKPEELQPANEKDSWYTNAKFTIKANDYPDPDGEQQVRVEPRWIQDPINAQNNCIVVTSNNNKQYAWDTQILIAVPEVLPEGSHVKLSMKVRADRKQAGCNLQSQASYTQYNSGFGSNNNITFTDTWTLYETETDLNADMCKNGGFQVIAINLAQSAKYNNFYFDDVEVTYKKLDPLESAKTDLQNKINEAKSYNSFAKTEDSWDDLMDAVEAGEDELEDEDATIESLEAAKDDIDDAIQGLTLQDGYTDLTKDMFMTHQEFGDDEGTVNTGCAYELNSSTSMPYGLSTVNWLNYADLSEYDKLIVIVTPGGGQPRFCFNRTKDEGQDTPDGKDSYMIDIPNKAWGTQAYETVNDEKTIFTIDLAKMVEEQGMAFLHSMKSVNGNIVVTDMLLYKEPVIEETDVTITMPEKYDDRTYSDEVALDFSTAEGLTAYIIVDVVEGRTILKEVTKVPANTGLYLVGKAGATYTVSVIKDFQSDEFKDNLLKSTINGVQKTEDGKTNYMLGVTSAGRGFHMLKKSGSYEQTKNKAYLSYAVDEANAPERLFIGEGEANRIANINVEKANGAWYTINGVKLNGVPTQKGMYIRNGKTIMIK